MVHFGVLAGSFQPLTILSHPRIHVALHLVSVEAVRVMMLRHSVLDVTMGQE